MKILDSRRYDDPQMKYYWLYCSNFGLLFPLHLISLNSELQYTIADILLKLYVLSTVEPHVGIYFQQCFIVLAMLYNRGIQHPPLQFHGSKFNSFANLINILLKLHVLPTVEPHVGIYFQECFMLLVMLYNRGVQYPHLQFHSLKFNSFANLIDILLKLYVLSTVEPHVGIYFQQCFIVLAMLYKRDA